MIVAGSTNPLLLASAEGGYNLTRSLRFRSSASAYLNRTPASAGNRQKWTVSFWCKRGTLGTNNSLMQAGTTGNQITILFFGADDKLYFHNGVQGTSTESFGVTSAVYRDPSAWYHIVFGYDTTQATASNRVFLYVNGVAQTLNNNGANYYPSQNYNTATNNTVAQYFGYGYTNSGIQYLDTYLTEVNFIDGQALTPSSFGETSPTTGVWQPKRYSGSYGTNGFYLPFTGAGTASYAGSFNGSNQWLNGSLTSAIGTGDFTVEAWVYQNTLTNYQGWLSIERGAGGFNIGTDAAGSLTFYSSSAPQISVSGVMKTGSWQHIAFVRSGTTLTAYYNGVSQGTATVSTNFSATAFYIGSLNNVPQELCNALLSNLRITGTAVYTSNFTPPTQALTAISGTKLLTLQNSTIVDNSGNSISITNNGSVTTVVSNPFLGTNIASDQSGQGNNWTPNNISLTAGSTYDSMTDVPTLTSATAANYCVLNPIYKSPSHAAASLSNGNLTATATGSDTFAEGTFAFPPTGKYYYEVQVLSTANLYSVGTARASSGSGTSYVSNGQIYQLGSLVTTITGWSTNDILGIAVNMDTNSVTFYRNNSSVGSWTAYADANDCFPASYLGGGSGGSLAYNFGQRPFAYTPPTGFVALNTFNLPTPTIGATASTQANKYFDISLYTGNGSTNTITNAGGFQPDWVWIKNRSDVYNHRSFDVLRGATKILYQNATDAEVTDANSLTSFNSNGFSLGSAAGTNNNTNAFVGWQWKANGTGVTNTDGSITSTVSANTSSGFSVVTYTGTGSNATVGHGLGVAPKMIIVKKRSASGDDWLCYNSNLGNTQFIRLNTTDAATTFNLWQNTTPTSTVFSLATDTGVNGSGATYVAYCFSEVAGFSKFGSYTGNGSADGTFVYTGFRPRYVMFKCSSTSGGYWVVIDTARNTYNLANLQLFPNAADADTTGGSTDQPIDILSNGFKLRGSGGAGNLSGETYIYMAFAENPFKYSLAR